jgi:hypothetical protein
MANYQTIAPLEGITGKLNKKVNQIPKIPKQYFDNK